MSRRGIPRLIPDALDPLYQMRVVGRFVRRTVKRPGTPPGTLVHTGEQKVERVRIRCMDYDAERLSELEAEHASECLPSRHEASITWVNVDGLHDVEVIRALGEHHGWHPLLLEDIVGTGQRAKLEEYDGYLYIVLPMLSWDPERRQVVHEQLSLVLGEGYVVTFQERWGDVFDGIRERLRQGRGRIRARGADYLAYALMDAVVDHCFQVLEGIGDVVEELEEDVLGESGRDTMIQLHALKRELIAVRRAVWPMRDMLAQVVRDDEDMFHPDTEIFLRDVHDHAVHVVEGVEVLRDVLAGAVDLHLSMLGVRNNEVMKMLTMMASIFIPLTFFAGIYGMNFEHMPELAVRWAYPAVLGAMAAVAVGLVLFFRRKGWL
jgi:magnesium transporter